MFFWRGKAEERSNTGVLQVMRQEKTKKYYLSGVTGSTLVTLAKAFTKRIHTKKFQLKVLMCYKVCKDFLLLYLLLAIDF